MTTVIAVKSDTEDPSFVSRMYPQDTIAAPATPAGSGAIAVIRISGPRAGSILRSMWRPVKSADLHPRRLYLGDIIDVARGTPVDRAMAVIMPGPASFTGEDVVELHCHGGPYLVRRILELALLAGARMAEPGEFSRRAFLNGRIDLTAAEAIADLIAARSEGAMAQALAQLNGSLKRRVEGLRSQLIAIAAHLEVEIDFADEDIDLPPKDMIAGQLRRLRRDVAVLHDSFARGQLLRCGVRAAIVGKPNVGKSSLLNLLLGVERAIVTPIPGTTRDVIEDTITLDGYSLVIQDTAGIRAGRDEVERIGIERTLESAARADLVITVFDGSRPLDEEDRQVLEACANRPGIAVLNKSDLAPALDARELRGSAMAMPMVSLSALCGDGLEALRRQLIASIAGLTGEGACNEVAVSRERHKIALARAIDALDMAAENIMAGMPPEIAAVDLATACEALSSITGEIGSEDVLDAIFSEFCIGK